MFTTLLVTCKQEAKKNKLIKLQNDKSTKEMEDQGNDDKTSNQICEVVTLN